MSIENFSKELPKEAGVAYRNSIAHEIWELRKDKGTDVAVEVLKSLKEVSKEFESMSKLAGKETIHHKEKEGKEKDKERGKEEKSDKSKDGVDAVFHFISGLRDSGERKFFENNKDTINGANLFKVALNNSLNREKIEKIEREQEKIELEKLIKQKEKRQDDITNIIIEIKRIAGDNESPRRIIEKLMNIKNKLPIEIKSKLDDLGDINNEKFIIKSLVDRLFGKTPERLFIDEMKDYLEGQEYIAQEEIPREIFKIKENIDSLNNNNNNFYKKELNDLVEKRYEGLKSFDKIGELGLIRTEIASAMRLGEQINRVYHKILAAQDTNEQLKQINHDYNHTSYAINTWREGAKDIAEEINSLKEEKKVINEGFRNLTDAELIDENMKRSRNLDSAIDSLKEKIKGHKEYLPELYEILGDKINKKAMFSMLEKNSMGFDGFFDYLNNISQKMFGCNAEDLDDLLRSQGEILEKIELEIFQEFNDQINQAPSQSFFDGYKTENLIDSFKERGGSVLIFKVNGCSFTSYCREHKVQPTRKNYFDRDDLRALKENKNFPVIKKLISPKFVYYNSRVESGDKLIWFPIPSLKVDGIDSAANSYCKQLTSRVNYTYDCDDMSVFIGFGANIEK